MKFLSFVEGDSEEDNRNTVLLVYLVLWTLAVPQM
jgi:hypothetical protein